MIRRSLENMPIIGFQGFLERAKSFLALVTIRPTVFL
jgi:hypothetical protein